MINSVIVSDPLVIFYLFCKVKITTYLKYLLFGNRVFKSEFEYLVFFGPVKSVINNPRRTGPNDNWRCSNK